MIGRIDTDTLKRMVADEEIDTVIAAFPDMYGRLVGKRLVARFFIDEVMSHGLHACDYLLACDMDMDPEPGYAFTSWAKGYGDFRSQLELSGIPCESSRGEWGPGQQEIGLRYADAVEMADRHVLYKHAAKEIAWKHGKAVAFMAKWDERYAGSSCHIHMSLWGEGGTKPLFAGDESLRRIRCSPIFRHFPRRWMAHNRQL